MEVEVATVRSDNIKKKLLSHYVVILFSTFVGGSVHQCGLFSVWDVWTVSHPPCTSWRGSRTSPLLWHTHLCPLVLGCTTVEQWTTGSVRDDCMHLSPWVTLISVCNYLFTCYCFLRAGGWLSVELLGPNKSLQWAISHQTLRLFPFWTLHQLSVLGLPTSIDWCCITWLATPQVKTTMNY